MLNLYNSPDGGSFNSFGGDQPSDWSVGRQSIAAGRWPELHHALSNRILPALCVQQDPDQCFGSSNNRSRERKTDTPRYFSADNFRFSAGRAERTRYGHRYGPGTHYLQ